MRRLKMFCSTKVVVKNVQGFRMLDDGTRAR